MNKRYTVVNIMLVNALFLSFNLLGYSMPEKAKKSSEIQRHIDQGIIYGDKGLLDKSIEEFEAGLAIDPQDADLYVNRGYAYQDKGDLERALSDYNKAITLNPNLAMAYNNRGFLLAKEQGHFNEGVKDFSKALELDPNLVIAYLN